MKKMTRILCLVLTVAVFITAFCGCSAISRKMCSHNYYLSDYTEATASADGSKTFTCSNCGNSYREIIPAQISAAAEETAPDLTRKRSVKLFDYPVYSNKNVITGAVDKMVYCAEKVDTDGWKHTDCYEICGAEYEAWVRYEISGKYTALSGKLYDSNSSGGAGWLEFYDGEEFLAATPKVDNENTSVEFEIDITGVDYLTVHFRSDKAGTWMIADDIVMTK